MKNINLIALTKAVAKKIADAARDTISVGKHEVDFTVRVKGTVSVFEDTEKTPTVSIPMKETLALFIRYSGITGPHAVALLQRAMTDALAANENGEQNPQGTGAIADALPIIEETMKTVVEPMLATLPKTPVKGMVKTNLEVTELAEVLT
jgi:hypothetical protein